MFRAIAMGAAATGLLGTIVAAEEVRVGARGGFYCADSSDIGGMIAGKFKDRPGSLGPSCKILDADTVLNADKVAKVEDMAVGRATIDGKEDVAFIVYVAATPKTSDGRTFKRVSPNDVRNTPTKWQGRDIEFVNVQVYWVSSDDGRIITGTNLTLFATQIRSADASFFSDQCETEREALSRKCRSTVRFSYSEHGEDTPNGMAKRTVLTSDDVELIRDAEAQRRRR